MQNSLLSIDLSENGICIAEVIGDTIKIIDSKLFKSKKELDFKEELDTLVRELDLKNKAYDDYSLSWFGQNSTLVPMNVFGESNAETIYKACFKVEKNPRTIDYTRISEHQIVNIFDIPEWVKSFFVFRFPRIVIQHENSLFLRGINKYLSYKLEIHLSLHKQHFHLMIFNNKSLVFFNTFESNTEDDLLYYLSFALQQQDFFGKAGKLFLYQFTDADKNMVDKFQQKLKSVEELSVLTLENTENLHLKYHKTCV